jgi:biopolymer transport protein ExbD
MRRRNMIERLEKDAGVDMTPLLDIVFILLIFFIVTTSFVKENGFLVENPKQANHQIINLIIL